MKKIKGFKISLYIQLLFLALGFVLWIWGWFRPQYNCLAMGVFLIWLANMVYACRDFSERLFFLIFHISLFIFALSRPISNIIKGKEWQKMASQSEESVRMAMLMITVSICGLFIGAVLAKVFKGGIFRKAPLAIEISQRDSAKWFQANLQLVALIVFYISIFFFFLQEYEKLKFMSDKSYNLYYSEFQSELPMLIHLLAAFMKYSFCLFLASLPTKKRAAIPMVIYILSAIPALIIGERNPIVLNCIFIFAYLFIRNTMNEEEMWFSRKEKLFVTILSPAAALFMVVYGNVRSGLKATWRNPFYLIVEFFHSQGATFDVIAKGYGYRLNLPHIDATCYSLGSVIDYFKYGSIGQMIWGTNPMPDGNNMIRALEGNSLSNHLSYVILKDDYLAGRGVGSSYILESYLDGGLIGCLFVGMVIGLLLVYAIYWMKKNTLLRTIVLVAITTVFFLPRAETSSFIVFLFTLQFWCCIGGCYLGAYICSKSKFFQAIFFKLHMYPNELSSKR
ncbi:oligosaccharide repeat unit polymerase [Lachnospiraceae bacterium PF1-22]|uniref:O-antigen polysaccharide polymerase Wzy family protein n=1 Tax=Ohessyouella blattaphilus TaxID=2949333 RepID=UPI003E26D0F1